MAQDNHGNVVRGCKRNNMTNKPTIFEELERVAAIIPYPLYWYDTNFVLLGANEGILNAVGGCHDVMVGKTPYHFGYKPAEAEALVQNCKKAIETMALVCEAILKIEFTCIGCFSAISAYPYALFSTTWLL